MVECYWCSKEIHEEQIPHKVYHNGILRGVAHQTCLDTEPKDTLLNKLYSRDIVTIEERVVDWDSIGEELKIVKELKAMFFVYGALRGFVILNEEEELIKSMDDYQIYTHVVMSRLTYISWTDAYHLDEYKYIYKQHSVKIKSPTTYIIE